MVHYHKPWLSLEEQVQKLADRGLDISDASQAMEYIYRIGYYRLTGYLHPFRKKNVETSDDGTIKVSLLSSYEPGTTLSQIASLVDYDRRLRLLMLDAVERIEISVRMRIGYALGKRSPFSHLDSSTFEDNFVRRYKHGAWVAKAQQSHQRSHELFVQHFDSIYEGQLPIWALTELLELGQLAVLYSGFQREIATELAASYGVPTKTHFRSWLASINDVRNFSAHHARLFNRKLIHAPKRPKTGTIAVLEHLLEPDSSKGGFGLYNVAAIMAYLLYNIEPNTTWPRQLIDLVDQFPATGRINIESMGFPPNWKNLDLWATSIPN